MPDPAGEMMARLGGVFIARCQAKDLSKGTIAWYRQILKTLTAHMAAAGVHDAAGITSGYLRGYLGSRRAAGLGSETLFRDWGALKCIFRFLHEEGLLPADPMAKVERPRMERHLIRPMDMTQVRKLLDQPDLSTKVGLEDRAMMLLMVDSGLRLSEVRRLETRSIFWQERLVTVLGKGRKERTIPIGRHALEAMERYQRIRGPGGQFFFTGRSGKPHTSKCVENRLRAYGRACGISGVRVSPHTLRHTFAIQYIRNGGDIFSLQSILGHSSLDMVRNYVNLARRDVSEQHQKFSPIDRLMAGESAP